eukprot:Colp12_sorted_trinity150504_noHs@7703
MSHNLQKHYMFWCAKKSPGTKQPQDYEKNIKAIGSFGTVQSFWQLYSYMIRPNDLPAGTDYLMFVEGIKPLWEDPNNIKGGKWIIRLKKGLASRLWEDLVCINNFGNLPLSLLKLFNELNLFYNLLVNVVDRILDTRNIYGSSTR